jgi:cytochrome P450
MTATPEAAIVPIPETEIVPTLITIRGWIQGYSWINDPFALLRSGAVEPPYLVYEQMRATSGPVTFSGLGFAVVVSYPLGAYVLGDPAFGQRINAEDPLRCRLQSSYLGMRQPDETRVREATAPGLALDRIDAMRERVANLSASLFGAVSADDGFDLVTGFADRLTAAALAEFLGVPEADREAFAAHSPHISALRDPLLLLDAREQVVHTDAVREIVGRAIDGWSDTSSPHLIATLADAHRVGVLERDEAVGAAVMVTSVVSETATALLANAVLALIERPDLWARLAAEPDFAAKVVAETARYDPPVQVVYRVVLQDMEVMGMPVPAGTQVAVATGATNRDPEVYADPDRFDPDRSGEPPPLPYDFPGADLSALLATAALSALSAGMPTIARSGKVKRRRWEAHFRAVRSLPVATADSA